VLKLRDDLAQLRRRGKQCAVAVIALLALIVGLVGWLVQRQNVLAGKLDKILAQGVVQYSAAETKVRQSQQGQKPEEIQERTYAELSKTLGIDARTLREKLPQFAEQLKNAPNVSTFERANAAYVAKDYNEAERLALAAADEAQRASPPKISGAIKALELAGNAANARIEYARALQHYRAAAQLTDRTRNALEWARQQWNIAFALVEEGKYAEGEIAYRGALAEYEKARGEEDQDVLDLRNDLATALMEQANTPKRRLNAAK
jgi:tetratricopeptide (TPR) repeat protein